MAAADARIRPLERADVQTVRLFAGRSVMEQLAAANNNGASALCSLARIF